VRHAAIFKCSAFSAPLNTDPGRSGLPVVAIVVRLVRFE
jgi:hypothetical protein